MSILSSRAALAAAILCATPAAQFTAPFPSSGSTVVASCCVPAGEIGSFFSASAGHSVSESFRATGLDAVHRLDLSLQVAQSVLASGQQTDWDVLLNDVVVGQWTANAAGPVNLSVSFAPIVGHGTYTVAMRMTNDVISGGGSISLGLPGQMTLTGGPVFPWPYPSSSSTWVGGAFTVPGEIGGFYSASLGHSISETLTVPGLHAVTMLAMSLQVHSALRPGNQTDWEVLVNGTVVGLWSVVHGGSGPVDLRYRFPRIAGRGAYTVTLRVANEVSPGGGFVRIAIPGQLRLSDALAPPADLSPGDPYRVMVVTDGTRDAMSTDIADYNAFVTADVEQVDDLFGLNTQWSAVASTATVFARDNTGTNATAPGIQGVPIYQRDGTRLADHYDDLWDGSVPVSPWMTATGALTSALAVWTGSASDGQPLAPGFSTPYPLGGSRAWLGSLRSTPMAWMQAGFGATTQSLHLYAMSGVLTVPYPATETVRAGGLPNPVAFLPGVSGPPVLGMTWDPVIDHTTFVPGAFADFMILSGAAVDLPLAGIATGHLLCDLTGAVVQTNGSPGTAFTLPIPVNPALLGQTLCAQGGSVDTGVPDLHFANALDVTIGEF
ncbi:MAG: hypothetical protein AAF628_35465 [Planctomycetota bacterium]